MKSSLQYSNTLLTPKPTHSFRPVTRVGQYYDIMVNYEINYHDNRYQKIFHYQNIGIMILSSIP